MMIAEQMKQAMKRQIFYCQTKGEAALLAEAPDFPET